MVTKKRTVRTSLGGSVHLETSDSESCVSKESGDKYAVVITFRDVVELCDIDEVRQALLNKLKKSYGKKAEGDVTCNVTDEQVLHALSCGTYDDYLGGYIFEDSMILQLEVEVTYEESDTVARKREKAKAKKIEKAQAKLKKAQEELRELTK